MAFRTRRQQRYIRYLDSGFLPFEANALSKVPFANAPFMQQAFEDRRELLTPLRREADQLGWSRTKYELEKRKLIAYDYGEKGLLYVKEYKDIIRIKGRPDPWQLFRYYKGESGHETPRYPKRKKHFGSNGIRVDKGNIKAQKERRRSREREKRNR